MRKKDPNELGKREKSILKYIEKQYGNHQILIFTCTKREQEILDELKIEYNYVRA